MKRNWITIVCVVFLVANVIYGYFQYQEIQKSNLLLAGLREQYNSEIFDLEIQARDRKQEMNFNGRVVDMNLTVADINNKTFRLSEVITSPKLILRYSEMNCDVCIETQIRNLNRLADSIGVRQIALFVTYRDSKYIKRFVDTYRVKFDVYKLDNELDSTLIDIEMPYYLMLTPSGNRVQCMFIPHKENPELTKYYLSLMKHKFYSKNLEKR